MFLFQCSAKTVLMDTRDQYTSPVDNIEIQSAALLHHVAEVIIQLGRSASDVQSRYRWAVLDYLDGHEGNIIAFRVGVRVRATLITRGCF